MHTNRGSLTQWAPFIERDHPENSVFMDRRVKHGDDGVYFRLVVSRAGSS